MAEEKETKDDALKPFMDAFQEFRDAMCSKMDAFGARMDAMEEKEKERADKARKDAEEAEEKAKKDAEEKAKADAEAEEKAKADAEEKAKADAEAEEKAKADAARADSATIASLSEQVEYLTTRLSAQPEHMAGYGAAQAKADAVFRLFGKQAPPPLVAEKLLDYRRRLLEPFQSHSPAWAKTDLKSLAAGDVFDNIEATVFADAEKSARDPSKVPGGQLRMVERKDESGHTIREYYGDPLDAMAPFIHPYPQIRRLRPRAA